MTLAEVVNAFLRVLEISTSCIWPLVTLFIVFLFHKQIRDFLPALSQRLTKAEIAGTKWEFSDVAVTALQDAIETGAEEFKDKPDKLVDFVKETVNKLPSKQEALQTRDRPSLIGKSILWVDDIPINNVYEANIMKQIGASIVTARSTSEANAFIERTKFDLVISDIHRFENNQENPDAGYELLESLMKQSKGIPLIFYTGSLSRVNKIRSKDAFDIATIPSRLVESVLNALSG